MSLESGMKVFGIAGWSGGGKTTLLGKLIPSLTRRGISVSTIKHAHHAFDVDKPGKDSHVHREAGAREVMISSAKRWALLHENRGEEELDLDQMLARMSPVDLVLVEGFKHHPHDKLEIHRGDNGKPLLQPDDPFVRAIASDTRIPGAPVPVFDLNDIETITDFVLASTGLGAQL
jgi:molybdopterin-guanine dinucleotide biosynthesis adapter protein